jgi:hypothetical protein
MKPRGPNFVPVPRSEGDRGCKLCTSGCRTTWIGFVSLNMIWTSVSDASEDADKNPLKLCRSVYTLLSEVRKPSFTFMK